MYNTDFLTQLEKFRQDLFGSLDPRNLPKYMPYILPKGVSFVECREAENGEYVPILAIKERGIDKILN